MTEAKTSSKDPAVGDSLRLAAEALVKAQERSVLLVEDTAAHAALIRRTLDKTVWTVEHVTRARAAIETFERDSNRIVLLDLSLPDSNGLQLLSKLRSVNPQVPMIVVTATDQVSVSVEAMQSGAWDYVVKADPKETGEKIVTALDRAWSHRNKNAEANLIEQSRLVELVRAQRLEAIESIVKTVCSEVNNPLSGVVALSQLILQHKDLDSDVQRLADGIAKSAQQVANVVQKLKNINDSSNEENSIPITPPHSEDSSG